MAHLPWRTLMVAAAALAVAATPALSPHAVLDRGAALDGEIWRLFSGHLVHGSASHLMWDVLPLLAIGLLFERALGARYWVVLGASALTISAGLLLMEPSLARYCGLSGTLNGLWVAGALQAARIEEASGGRAMARIYRTCVLGDLAKIAFEASTGAQIFTGAASLGVTPVPLAHALGALAGAICLSGRARGDGPDVPHAHLGKRIVTLNTTPHSGPSAACSAYHSPSSPKLIDCSPNVTSRLTPAVSGTVHCSCAQSKVDSLSSSKVKSFAQV